MKTTIYILVVCLIVALAFVGAQAARSRKAAPLVASRSVEEARTLLARNPLRAYMAHFEERITGADRQPVLSRTIEEAWRPDGSHATTEQNYHSGGRPLYSVRHIWFSNGVRASIWNELNVVVARRDVDALRPAGLKRLLAQSDCLEDFSGEQRFQRSGSDDVIAGLRAVRVRPINAGKRASYEQWFVPSARCIEARRIARFADETGKETGISDLVATSISLVEPPPDRFVVPKSLEAVAPSVAYKRLMPLVKGTLCEGDLKALEAADKEYAASRVEIATLQ